MHLCPLNLKNNLIYRPERWLLRFRCQMWTMNLLKWRLAFLWRKSEVLSCPFISWFKILGKVQLKKNNYQKLFFREAPRPMYYFYVVHAHFLWPFAEFKTKRLVNISQMRCHKSMHWMKKYHLVCILLIALFKVSSHNAKSIVQTPANVLVLKKWQLGFLATCAKTKRIIFAKFLN